MTEPRPGGVAQSMNNMNLVQTFANNGGPITYFQNFEDALHEK